MSKIERAPWKNCKIGLTPVLKRKYHSGSAEMVPDL